MIDFMGRAKIIIWIKIQQNLQDILTQLFAQPEPTSLEVTLIHSCPEHLTSQLHLSCSYIMFQDTEILGKVYLKKLP